MKIEIHKEGKRYTGRLPLDVRRAIFAKLIAMLLTGAKDYAFCLPGHDMFIFIN